MPEETEEESEVGALLQQLQKESWTPGDILHYGPERRTLAIWCDISSESVLPIISQLLELEHRSPGEPIKVHLCTEGGSLSAALALFDTMRMITSPVIITATGVCASAGLLILAAGDRRYSTENTQFFYHQPIMPGEAPMISAEMVTETANAYIEQQVNYDKLIRERCEIDDGVWSAHFEGKVAKYFSPHEAATYGLIHRVIENKGG